MKIFVAGATGVVGRRLVPLLVRAGHEVVGMSRSAERAEALESFGVRGVVGNVFDPRGLADLLARDPARDRRSTRSPTSHERWTLARPKSSSRPTCSSAASAPAIWSRRRPQPEPAASSPRATPTSTRPSAAGSRSRATSSTMGDHVPAGRRRNVEAVVALERAVLTTPGSRASPFATARCTARALPSILPAAPWPTWCASATIRWWAAGRAGRRSSHVDDAAAAAVLALDGPPGVYNITDDRPAPASEWLPYYAAALGAPPPRHVPALAVRALGREHFAFRSTRQRAADNRKARSRLGFTPAVPDVARRLERRDRGADRRVDRTAHRTALDHPGDTIRDDRAAAGELAAVVEAGAGSLRLGHGGRPLGAAGDGARLRRRDARRHGRQRRAADHRPRLPHPARDAAVDGHRLHAHAGRPDPHRRLARRPLRPPPGLRDRRRLVRGGVAALRRRAVRDRCSSPRALCRASAARCSRRAASPSSRRPSTPTTARRPSACGRASAASRRPSGRSSAATSSRRCRGG